MKTFETFNPIIFKRARKVIMIILTKKCIIRFRRFTKKKKDLVTYLLIELTCYDLFRPVKNDPQLKISNKIPRNFYIYVYMQFYKKKGRSKIN